MRRFCAAGEIAAGQTGGAKRTNWRYDRVRPPPLHVQVDPLAAFAPYKIFALVETARSFGIAPEAILHGTGLDLAGLEDGKSQTSVSQYLQACSNAVRRCPDPMLPTAVGRNLHLSAYGLYGFALLSSSSVRAGFEFAVRYHDLATPTFDIRWQVRDGDFVWYFPDEAQRGYAPPLKSFLMTQQIAAHITHVQDVARADRLPKRVLAAIDRPDRPDLVESALGCAVTFGAAATEIIYDMSILDERPPLTNPVTHAMLRESCERLIGVVTEAEGVSRQVSRLLLERLAPFPSIEAIASRLGMTARTLRRRLTAEGSSYSGLLDQVRNELAKKYLGSGAFTVADISDLVGFSDVANFRSAFRRWNGVAPNDYRATLGRDA
jgi:AraC-like DNA-binding protein